MTTLNHICLDVSLHMHAFARTKCIGRLCVELITAVLRAAINVNKQFSAILDSLPLPTWPWSWWPRWTWGTTPPRCSRSWPPTCRQQWRCCRSSGLNFYSILFQIWKLAFWDERPCPLGWVENINSTNTICRRMDSVEIHKIKCFPWNTFCSRVRNLC